MPYLPGVPMVQVPLSKVPYHLQIIQTPPYLQALYTYRCLSNTHTSTAWRNTLPLSSQRWGLPRWDVADEALGDTDNFSVASLPTSK